MAFCSSCGKELPSGAAFCPACGASARAAQHTAAPSSGPTGLGALATDPRAQDYWGRRLGAFAIDAVIALAVSLAILSSHSVGAFISGGVWVSVLILAGTRVLAFSWGIAFVLYFTVAESAMGASIGKRMLGLRVVSKARANPNLVEFFVRNLSKIFWLIVLLDAVVGLATSKRYTQKYTDRLMGTDVIERPPLVPMP